MSFDRHKAPPDEVIGPRVNFLSRLIRQKFNEAIASEGLFSGQQEILFAIAKNEGVTSSELASRTGVSAATISVSVKRMKKAGFIIKKPDENDARIIRLYPTEKAKAAPKNIRHRMDKIEVILKRGMTEDEALQFSKYLQLAIDNLSSEYNIIGDDVGD